MINTGKIYLAALVLCLGNAVNADELMEASRGLCDNIKSCALEQIAREDLTPEMRQMMEPMLENMCAAMSSRVQEVPTGHGMYQPALACVRSMQSLTCQQMQNQDQVVTPECRKYEELARKAAGSQ